MKIRGFGGILAVVCITTIVGIVGCAMHSQTMKTGNGENIATWKLTSDQCFKDHHLVKVALERNKESGFYGAQGTYMNEVAFKALTEGTVFPENSKIILAFFSFSDKNKVVLPGEKMWSATMEKTMAETTGNWVYSSIDHKKLEPKFPDPIDTCYIGCHKAKENNDYVFLEHPLNKR